MSLLAIGRYCDSAKSIEAVSVAANCSLVSVHEIPAETACSTGRHENCVRKSPMIGQPHLHVPRKPGICANLGLPCANPEFQVCRENLESRDVLRRLTKASALQAMFWLNSSLFNYSSTTGMHKSNY